MRLTRCWAVHSYSEDAARHAVWRPGPEHIARSRLAAAMKRWGFASLEEFHAASVDQPEWFWPAAAEDLGIPLRRQARSMVRDETRAAARSRAGSTGRRSTSSRAASTAMRAIRAGSRSDRP